MLDEGAVVPARKSASISEFASDLPHHVTRQLRQSVRLNGVAGDIMQAARELFETEGVAATSMAAIARKAGVARSLVYYYFPDKQAVIDAVLDDFLEDIVESVDMERAACVRRHAHGAEELRCRVQAHFVYEFGAAAPHVRCA